MFAEAAHQREPHPRAFARERIAGIEPGVERKELRNSLRRQSRPGIEHPQYQTGGFRRAFLHRDDEPHFTPRSVFHGVAQQIAEDLAQPGFVAHQGVRHTRRNLHVKSQLLRDGRRARGIFRRVDRCPQRKRLRAQREVARFERAEIEQIVDETEQELTLLLDGCSVPRHRRFASEQFGAAENCLQRRAQFMADEGEELRARLLRHLLTRPLHYACLLDGLPP